MKTPEGPQKDWNEIFSQMEEYIHTIAVPAPFYTFGMLDLLRVVTAQHHAALVEECKEVAEAMVNEDEKASDYKIVLMALIYVASKNDIQFDFNPSLVTKRAT